VDRYNNYKKYLCSNHLFLGNIIILKSKWSRHDRIVDLQLPVQSVLITTKVVSFNPVHGEMYLDTTLCDKVCQWLATGRWFSLVSSTNKTDRHNINQPKINFMVMDYFFWQEKNIDFVIVLFLFIFFYNRDFFLQK